MEAFDADRYLVDQVVRPIANLYRITPLAAGETPAGPPVAYVRQKKLAIKEDIRFYADEQETEELFQIKARNILDLGGSRYDVYAGEKQIGALEHQFRASLLRSTWRVRDASNQEIAVARERSLALAIARRVDRLRPGLRRPDPDPVQLRPPDRGQDDRQPEPQVQAARQLRARPLGRPRPAARPAACDRARDRARHAPEPVARVFEAMQWLNEPASWSIDGERLTVTPQAESDFWRNTFYGFVHDNGHFFHREVRGDFTAEVTLIGSYENLYDQSGLMVRSDERRWIKAGLELTDGAVHMSTVLTRDHSDWAVLALPAFDGRCVSA